MAEISNDSRNVIIVEDTRATFTIESGGRSGTPTIEVPVTNGNMLEVNCQFIANPSSDVVYEIKSLSNDTTKLTRRPANTAGNTGGWQVATRTDYFIATLPPGDGADDATFEVLFSSGSGEAGSFLLVAKIVGSKLIPA
ncbi:MAG: hypothetical protein AAGE94_02075 [Acidobacteriota bacterium]